MPWPVQMWKDFLASPPGVQHLREEVDVTVPPYSTRYPDLKDIFNPDAMSKRTNIDRNNTRLTADATLASVMSDGVSKQDRARALRAALPQPVTFPTDQIGPSP
jgi:hypothetical protein